MEINGNNIKYININITNKKTRNVLTEKYFNFLNYDPEEDKTFFNFFVEILLKFKGNTNNIDIIFFDDSIYINCYYSKLFNKKDEYNNIVKNYISLMNKISIEYNEYCNNANFWHDKREKAGAPVIWKLKLKIFINIF